MGRLQTLVEAALNFSNLLKVIVAKSVAPGVSPASFRATATLATTQRHLRWLSLPLGGASRMHSVVTTALPATPKQREGGVIVLFGRKAGRLVRGEVATCF